MAASLLSDRLHTTNGTSKLHFLTNAERRQIIDLLRASARCVEEGACDPVVYRTMGALHQYAAMCAALISPEVALAMKSPFNGEQPPGVVDSDNFLEHPKHVIEPSPNNEHEQSSIGRNIEKRKEEQKERERLKAEHQKKLQAEARQMEAKKKAEKLEKERQMALEQQRKQELDQRKQQEDQQKRLEAIETKQATADNTPQPLKHKPMSAAEKQKQRMEREIAARKRAEDERRRIEIEYEQQKKERIEQRRRDLEAKRKLAREEQKRKEQIQKQKFLESEQRKEAMKAAAMKPISQKASQGVFSTKASSSKKDSDTNEKGNLWYSLNKHMSAFEMADRERKRREAEKQDGNKSEQGEEEDPEVARKRIAEQARQRLMQDEVEKRRMEAEAAGGTYYSHGSVSPTTSQNSQATSLPSVSSPLSAQHKSAAASMPTVPPLHHTNTQSWNKIHQPPYPQQQPQKTPLHRPKAPPNPKSDNYPQQQANIPVSQPQTASQSAYRRSSASSSAPPAKAQQAPQPRPSNSDFSESELKRNVLVQWGLVPPNMQVLKPVDELLCSIHGVFPPSFGVASHEYFSGWKAIDRSELVTNGILDETKLKKSVRRVRFFLHPDKLPHDLSEDQGFLCKLLWDVINDAFEEYKRSKEDLDWL